MVSDHKTWTSGNWKREHDVVRGVILHAILYIRNGLRLENNQGSLQSGMPGSNNETWGRFCDGLGRNIMVLYSVGPIITLHGRITARDYMYRLGNQVHPMIQMLFLNNDAVCKTTMPLFTQLELFSHVRFEVSTAVTMMISSSGR
jgi:hypothetical protein